MKRILFLSYVYPYGYYNASAACSVKIMNKLVESGDCEVHCISYRQYDEAKQPYALNRKIKIHPIDLKERKHWSKTSMHAQIVLRMPIYPLFSPYRIWSHYKSCKAICKKEKFDLVVAQCYPEESALVGAFLKKNGIIDKLVVIFWDNIYGKKPARIIPLKFAQRRQKIVENFIAKYSTKLISLYPIKRFHDLFGDVKNAKGKRAYLGIPSVSYPIHPIQTKHLLAIKEGYINILYSGTIIKPQFVFDLLDMLNKSRNISKINLLFYCQGLDDKTKEILNDNFKGNITISGYIPLQELFSVYHKVDVFVSFPGDVNSICSKCYEYMSYGHPMIVFYDNKEDVNKTTFSKYPLCLTQDITMDVEQRANEFDRFLAQNLGKKITYKEVEDLFITDTAKAYVNFINEMV